MPKTRVLTMQAVPGAVLGEAFTASIPTRAILPQVGEAFWESLNLGLKADITAAVTITMETFLGLLNPLVFIANEPRILARGRDLFALSTAFYKEAPYAIEGASNQDDKVHGIRIPIQVLTKATESYGWNATRVAVANLGAEVLSLSVNYLETPPGKGRIDAREIPFTTPAAAGIAQVTPKLPKVGNLIGLLVFVTTAPTPTTDTCDVQNLFLDTPTRRLVSATWSDLQSAFATWLDMTRANATEMVLRNLLTNYGFLDFRDEPIDAIANDIALSIDAEVVSEAARFIPVYEVPQ